MSFLPKKLPHSIDNAIENTTDKTTTEIGTTLADIWYLVFGGLSQVAEKTRARRQIDLEDFKKKCRDKINLIPEEKRVEPNFQIVGSALEDSKYCIGDEELRLMFANLIASAMDADRCNDTHPSFSNVIKQLSPIDAKYFSTFEEGIVYPICRYKVNINDNQFEVSLSNAFLVENQLTQFASIEASSLSMDVLSRLGIIFITYENTCAKERYSMYKETEFFSKLNQNQKGDIIKGLVTLTRFGACLRSVCLEKSRTVELVASTSFPDR